MERNYNIIYEEKVIENNQIFAFATLLDPRFKRLDFNSASDCSLAVSKLNQAIQDVPLTQIDQQPVTHGGIWKLQ